VSLDLVIRSNYSAKAIISRGTPPLTRRTCRSDSSKAPTPDEEAYLAAVTALLARVENTTTWRESPAGKDWTMDTITYYPPIVLMQIKMAPGSVINLHDYRHYNGVLLATQGARLRKQTSKGT